MPTRSDGERAPTTLQTVERALAFLEVVAQAPKPLALKEVAEQLGLNITTGYHLLNTLVSAGYVVRDADSTLRIGSRVALLYQGMMRRFVVGRDLHPIIEDLTARTQETAYLTTFSGDGVVVQTFVEAPHAVRVSGLYVGFSGAEHKRASGKAVLAFLDEGARSRLLNRCLASEPEEQRVATMEALERELAVVRRKGWALDNQQFHDAVCCVGAPYFSADGSVAGSIAVSAPATRFNGVRGKLAGAVCDAARTASEVLGHELLKEFSPPEAAGPSSS